MSAASRRDTLVQLCAVREAEQHDAGAGESVPREANKGVGRQQPQKNDCKDPKTIAKLVSEGRYTFPYMPEGIYADLRQAVSSRDRIVKELNALTNRIQRWLQIYFPEFLKVYGKFSAESALLVLETAPYPADVIALGADGVNQIWREHKLRAVGMKRATTLVEAARKSVGMDGGVCAKLDLPRIRSNEEFREVYHYYTTRQKNPLKGKQAVVAVAEGLLAISGVVQNIPTASPRFPTLR